MNQLVEAVLAVGAWFAEVYLAHVKRHNVTVGGNALAVALHVYLLDVRGKADQRLGVRKQGTAWMTEECAVPDANQTHQHR